MFRFLPRYLCATLLLLMLPLQSWGLDLENETLPSGVSKFVIKSTLLPSYNQFQGGGSRQVDIHEVLIRDSDIRKHVRGDMTRSRTEVNFGWQYGLSSDWVLALNVPFISLEQSTDLEALPVDLDHRDPADLSLRVARAVERLEEKDQVSGVGDVVVRSQYTLNWDDNFGWRVGFGLRLPSGSDDGAYGIYPMATGDGQVDMIFTKKFVIYTPFAGLKNDIFMELTNQLKGKRASLSSEREENFYPGNEVELQYNWTYERANWFYGGGFFHYFKTPGVIGDLALKDRVALTGLATQIGFGNLSSLEEEKVAFPFQFRIGTRTYFHQQNHPLTQPLELIFFGYF